MKKIEAAGFADPEKAAEYFMDKEVISPSGVTSNEFLKTLKTAARPI
jgi:2-iminoacetate synthase ThiH